MISNNKTENRNRGFSLIELIVVITIIAVMTTVAIISYGPANKRSRDSRRMADLEKMRVALEMARQIGVTYPNSASLLWVSMGLMQAQPSDPKGGSYDYAQGASGYTYTLRASMEGVGSTNGSYGAGCGSVCNYQITNP